MLRIECRVRSTSGYSTPDGCHSTAGESSGRSTAMRFHDGNNLRTGVSNSRVVSLSASIHGGSTSVRTAARSAWLTSMRRPD